MSGKLFALWPAIRRGLKQAIALPANSTVHLLDTSGDSDVAFASVEGMLTPPTLFAATPSDLPVKVQSLPAKFDAARFTVEQKFAMSRDGTKVPYFLARKKGVGGPVPTLIHA